jgi:hypothetical protein
MKKQSGFQRQVITLGVVALGLSMSQGFVTPALAQDAVVAPTAVATAAVATASVLPQAEAVTVQVLAPVGPFTVGDPIELTVQVTHPAGTQVILPQLAQTWGDLEVREQRPAQTTTNADGALTTVQTIVATVFAPGDLQTPPLAVTVSDAAGQLSQAVAAPAALTIGSVLAEGDAELRDIKPQAELAIPAAVPYPAIMAGVAALAVALLGFLLWRRRANRQPVDKRTPDQAALDELARIGGLNLPAAGRYAEHYAATAACLRTYLERQFAIPARDRTTLEITAALRTAPFAPANAQTLVTLLAECDLVKFAKVTPGVAAATGLLDEARRFVTLTTADKLAAASQATAPYQTVPTAATI